MRTLCDVCESAAATIFCAADEAALCRACDEKVHMCNKLARRHVRVGLAEPCDVLMCDICENAPAFFYCDIDGSSLCLQCDMIVHVGGKRSHARFLLLRQRIEFPGEKPGNVDEFGQKQPGNVDEFGQKPSNSNEFRRRKVEPANLTLRENKQDDNGLSAPMIDNNYAGGKMNCNLIDLNARPLRMNCQNPANEKFFVDITKNRILQHLQDPLNKNLKNDTKVYFSLFHSLQEIKRGVSATSQNLPMELQKKPMRAIDTKSRKKPNGGGKVFSTQRS